MYGKRSQLAVIFNVLGTPTENDLAYLDSRTRVQIRQMAEKSPMSFRTLYPATDDTTLNLLRSMLEFNPKYRNPASNAMTHPYFKTLIRHSYIDNFIRDASNNNMMGDVVPTLESLMSPTPMSPDEEKTAERMENLQSNVSHLLFCVVMFVVNFLIFIM